MVLMIIIDDNHTLDLIACPPYGKTYIELDCLME